MVDRRLLKLADPKFELEHATSAGGVVAKLVQVVNAGLLPPRRPRCALATTFWTVAWFGWQVAERQAAECFRSGIRQRDSLIRV